MNIYLINYEYNPAEPESSIVIAENEKEAISIVRKELKNECFPEEDIKIEKCIKVPLEKGIIYTGNFCC